MSQSGAGSEPPSASRLVETLCWELKKRARPTQASSIKERRRHGNNGGKSEDPTPRVKARDETDVHDARVRDKCFFCFSAGSPEDTAGPGRRASYLAAGKGRR